MEAIDLLQEMCSNKLDVTGLTQSPFDDFFLGLSEGNRTVETVTLHLSSQAELFSSWEKVGKAIGNLEALQEIELTLVDYPPHELVPDWYTLSNLLSFLRHQIKLRFGYYRHWNEVELQPFATAIRHNPFIKAIDQGGVIPTTCFYIFVNVLATLPALEDVTFETFAHRDPLRAINAIQIHVLLQSRSLRSLTFYYCCIKRETVQCLTSALNGNGSTLACLQFYQCDFLDGGPDEIGNTLRTNTSLTHLEFSAVTGTIGDAFIGGMRQLLRPWRWRAAIITALRYNTTLKKCTFHMDEFEDPPLFDAMRALLERKSTLECLTFARRTIRDDLNMMMLLIMILILIMEGWLGCERLSPFFASTRLLSR
jgi:hypothetical protein